MCGLLQQVEINDKMRGILIDWLVEVHLKFKVTLSSWELMCAHVPLVIPFQMSL